MKNAKRFMALGLAMMLAVSTAACGGAENASGENTEKSGSVSTEHRDFTIGSWWRQYYDSTDENMEVSSDWENAQFTDADDEATRAEKEVNQKVALAKWDKVKTLEEKYNCTFSWQNLTYAGTQESINTSILAGSPDCDIYMVDTTMAVPAQANGLLVDLKTILPEDDDIFTDQSVFSYLDLGDGKACIIKVQGGFENTYPLGFNKQMLDDAKLEDPRDLYERGEWTWDKFIEYCQALTQDTDKDGQIDQYGFCGYQSDMLNALLMSNGNATICGGTTCTLGDTKVGEALQMMQDMFVKYNVCYPYDFAGEGGSPSDSMRNQYNEGNIAFFPAAVWIMNSNGNYPAGKEGNLTWDTCFVQWPVGPSGSKETNTGVNAAGGNFFVIPAGVKDPATVYQFLFDLYNWFDYDTSLRDNPATVNWWYQETAKVTEINDANFEVQKWSLQRPSFELYESLGVEYDLESLIRGDVTPAQFQETYKQPFQDALNAMFN